jgi:hypothetical protein
MKTTTDTMRELLRQVMATQAREIDCDEFLVRVGSFLEKLRSGETLPPEMKAVLQHLEVCGECKEELEALLRAHQGDD